MNDQKMILNEQIKMRSVFYNNASVALGVTGFAVPFVAVSGNDMKVITDCVGMFYNGSDAKLILADISYGVISVIGAAACAFFSRMARRRSNDILRGLQ